MNPEEKARQHGLMASSLEQWAKKLEGLSFGDEDGDARKYLELAKSAEIEVKDYVLSALLKRIAEEERQHSKMLWEAAGQLKKRAADERLAANISRGRLAKDASRITHAVVAGGPFDGALNKQILFTGSFDESMYFMRQHWGWKDLREYNAHTGVLGPFVDRGRWKL